MLLDKPEHADLARLFVLGFNHRTAPLQLREQLAQTADEQSQALDALAQAPLEEVVVLATCNRLEVYGVTSDTQQGMAAVLRVLASLRNLSPEELLDAAYMDNGHGAIAHLMRVASGVDSMILGEAQILGQVSAAFATAQVNGAAGPVLSHLFTLAAHAGKRARTETDISRYITSVSHAAVYMAQQAFPNLNRAQALVIGSGEMAFLAAQALHRHDVHTIRCVNRTYARAVDLAQAFDGEALDWQHLPDALADADVVITATSAPHPVIGEAQVKDALARRGDRPLVMIDIALPRDVDEAARRLPGVQYYDLDSLNQFVESNVARREAAIADVNGIVDEEIARFVTWYSGRSNGPVIAALRQKAAAQARDEVDAALRRLGDLDPNQQRVVELMAHRIVNKILHEPTVRLKAGAADSDYASVVRDLFALDDRAE